MRRLAIAAAVALVLATAATLLADAWWPLELAGHFRAHLVAGAAVAALLALWRGPRALSPALLALGAWHVAAVENAPYLPRAANAASAAEPALRVVTFNVLWNNARHDDVVAFLRQTDADVIVLQEVTARWHRALRPLAERYPHQLPTGAFDEEGPGIVILSKTPVVARATRLPYAAVADISWRGRRVLLAGVHTVLPLSAWGRGLQARTFADIAALTAGTGGAALVIGDFNHTPYTPAFRRFADAARLAAARHPGLWPYSWRARFADAYPLGGFLGLPIDQVLANGHFSVRAIAYGPALGSDHRPLVVDLVPRP